MTLYKFVLYGEPCYFRNATMEPSFQPSSMLGLGPWRSFLAMKHKSMIGKSNVLRIMTRNRMEIDLAPEYSHSLVQIGPR